MPTSRQPVPYITDASALRFQNGKPRERTPHMATSAVKPKPETLRTLPGDDVRQIMWRFADRYDLQMLVQSSRSVARGPVARLVAAGARNTPRLDRAASRAAPGLRRRRHHRRLHGPRAGRLHRRPQEPGAGPGRLRTRLGGCRRRHRQPGRMPRARAHPRARHRTSSATTT